MSKVAVIARLEAKSGARQALLDVLSELMGTVESEEGTLLYAFHEATDHDDVIWAYELYADQAAFDAHSSSSGMAEMIGKLGGLLGGAPELHVVRPVTAKGFDL